MSVQIIVDSAADMPQKVIEQEKLTVVPLRTIFGNEEYLDGVTITAQQFYEKLIEDTTHPSTSQPSPYEFQQIFEQVVSAGDSAVVITLSSKLSGTYQSASIAASEFADQIYVVDSENVTIGEPNIGTAGLTIKSSGVKRGRDCC